MDEISKIKILLNITDNTEDALLGILMENAVSFIKRTCFLDEVSTEFNPVLRKMVIFDYRKNGSENLKSESAGSLMESFLTEYPQDILNEIYPYRRIRV